MTEKTGILLSNLGSPTAATEAAVKIYLKQFLSDPRVIQLPKIIWQPILQGIVLKIRPKKTAAIYQKIWNETGSPLLAYSVSQKNALQKLLGENYLVEIGMRYGSPSIEDALKLFQQQKIAELVFLPLYPQFSYTTTASSNDALEAAKEKLNFSPKIHAISDYYNNQDYILMLTQQIQNYWENHGRQDKILFSFHGIPKAYVKKGDPYYQQCLTTGKLLAQSLQLAPDQWLTVFQSRFGFQTWLQPYCIDVLKQLPKQGIKNIDIVCPGFPTDCLETLEEIAMTNKKIFIENGGENYRYIPALNADRAQIKLFAALIDTAKSKSAI